MTPRLGGTVVFKTEVERLEEERAEEKRRENRYRKRQFLFNGILTVATVVNVGVASYQGYLLREYTRLTKVSADASTKTAIAADGALKSSNESFSKTLVEMQKQSAAMEINAQAAKSSAGIAGETLKRSVVSFKQETRPYVTVETAQLKEKPATGITLEVITNLHNTGRTPALNLRIAHRFDVQSNLPCRYRSDLLIFGSDFGIIDTWIMHTINVPSAGRAGPLG